MKKILCRVLILALAASLISVPNIAFGAVLEIFDDIELGTEQEALDRWDIMAQNGSVSVRTEDGNRFLELNKPAAASGDVFAEKNIDPLTGEITVEASVRNPSKTSCNALFIRDDTGQPLIMIFFNANNLFARTAGNENTNLVVGYSPDRWYRIKVTANTQTSQLSAWVDGEQKITDKGFRGAAVNLSNLLFGGPNSEAGSLYVDDVRLSAVVADSYLVSLDKKSLSLGDLTGIVDDFDLVMRGENGSEIVWSSTDESVIRINGSRAEVIRPPAGQTDVALELIATISSGTASDTKRFPVTVLMESDFEQEVALAAAALTLENAYAVTADIALPQTGLFGTHIAWESADESVVRISGETAQVIRGGETVDVTLVATVTKETFHAEKEIVVRVLRSGIENDMYAVNDTFEDGDDEANLGKWKLTDGGGKTSIITDPENRQGKVLEINKTSTLAVNTYAERNFSQLSGRVKIKVKLKADTNNANAMYLRDEAGTTFASFSLAGSNLTVRVQSGSKVLVSNWDPKKWYSIEVDAIVAKDMNLIDIYVDGEKKVSGDGPRQKVLYLSNLLFGMTTADTGRVFVDDLSVYCEPSYDVEQSLQGLTLDVGEPVTKDFMLPVSGGNNTVIEWISSNEEVIRIEDHVAVVTRPPVNEQNAVVSLTAIVSKYTAADTKTFEVSVLRRLSDAEAVKADAEQIKLSGLPEVKKDLPLPVSGDNGSTIEWESDAPELIGMDGKVTRPGYGNGENPRVSLTARVKKGECEEKREFTATVIRMNYAEDCFLESSSVEGSHLKMNAADDDWNSCWQSKATDVFPWLQLDMKRKQKLNMVVLKQGASKDRFRLLCSDNGVNWSELAYRTTEKNDNIFCVFDPIETKLIKYEVLEKAGTNACVYEMQLYFELTDQISVALDRDWIDLGEETRIKSDLRLPGEGPNGSAISWSSSNEDVLSSGGSVKRDRLDREAVLTAVLSKGTAQETKLFKFTVVGTGEAAGGTNGGGGGTVKRGQSVIPPTVPKAVTEEEPAKKPIFADVPESFWAYSYIRELAERNIISGYDDGSFQPDHEVKREEFIKMLIEALELTDRSAESTFSDVTKDAWYYPYVAAAEQLGLVTGDENGSFRVASALSREDMAVIAGRALRLQGVASGQGAAASFHDAGDISEYARADIAYLCGLSVVSGDETGNFMPRAFLTRAQAAKVICKVLERRS